MINKKTLIIPLVILISVLVFAAFALAATPQVAQAGSTIAQNAANAVSSGGSGFFNSMVSATFGGLFNDQQWLTKFFLSILLGMLIYTIVGSIFGENWYIKGTATAIIVILSIWFLPSSFITAILAQYGPMGAAILSVIPFIILLIFSIRVKSILVGRVVWVFYILYYFALYAYQVWGVVNSTGWLSPDNVPYLAAIIAGIIIFFFFSAIRNMVFKGEMEGFKTEAGKVAARTRLLNKVEKERLEAEGAI